MIDQVLPLICARLNENLRRTFQDSDDLAVLGPPMDGEGKISPETRNCLALFMTDLQRDSVPRPQQPGVDKSVSYAAPIYVDLHFVIAANFDVNLYSEGLKVLSAALIFFQSSPFITETEAPDLPPSLRKIALDFCAPTNDQDPQSSSTFGGRLLPSARYRVRGLVIDGHAPRTFAPLIRQSGSKARSVEPAPQRGVRRGLLGSLFGGNS